MLGNVTLWGLVYGTRCGAAIIRQHTNIIFYSSFKESCRQIVYIQIIYPTSEEKASLKFTNEGKIPPEKCPRGTSASQRIASKEKSYPSRNLSSILGPI